MPTSQPVNESASATGADAADNGTAAARTVLDLFASVGATRFTVSWLKGAHQPPRPRGLRKSLEALGGPLPKADNEDWLDAAAGEQEVLFRLPTKNETISLIDQIKERQGLRNRGQVLEQLIDLGRQAPSRKLPRTEKPALPGGLSKLVTGLKANVGDISQSQTSQKTPSLSNGNCRFR